MTTKILLVSMFLTAACTASEGTSHVISDGPGSDMGSDGSDAPAPDGAIYGQIYDERNDAIDFSSGAPVHTHTGVTTDLADECPDVYKFAYLMDDHAPIYGSEMAPNPLAWHVKSPGAASAQYRVRTNASQLRDWTPMVLDGGDTYTATIHRNDTELMQSIGKQTGKFYIDTKITDASNVEVIKTACWNNHPMAAPLDVKPVMPSDLFTMTFAAQSPLSNLMNLGAPGAHVIALSFTQSTGEAVPLTISAAPPTGTGMKQERTKFIAVDSFATNDSCGTTPCLYVVNPDPITTTVAVDGNWTLSIVEQGQSTNLCTGVVEDGHVTCTIPGRTSSPRVFTAYLTLAQASITPTVPVVSSTTFSDQLVGALWVSGQVTPGYTVACSAQKIIAGTPPYQHVCTQRTDYTQVHALNQATLAFNPVTFALSTAVGDASTALTPSYVPASTLTFAAQTWDTGIAGL